MCHLSFDADEAVWAAVVVTAVGGRSVLPRDATLPGIGKGPKAAKLPNLKQMIWNNELRDKVDWLVAYEMWASRHKDARFFDCRGTCR